MTSSQQTITNLIGSIDSVTELATTLSDEQLAVQSLCPDWTVHGVLGHLFGLEQVLSGWFPDGPEDPPPFAQMGPLSDEISGLSSSVLIERITAIGNTRKDELNALDADAMAAPSLTPVGVSTYGKFMAIRVFDFWVHEQDIRVPLGLVTETDSDAAEQAMDEIEGSLGYIVGKKIGLEDQQSIKFTLTGPVERTMCVKVDGRAAQVDSLTDPDVELTSDSLTFALLACGRIDPEEAISAGKISWSGDDAMGAHAARNLRYTM
jgi:uncharacterized protein (TIGR03083 family)